jgi:hypothetical protein
MRVTAVYPGDQIDDYLVYSLIASGAPAVSRIGKFSRLTGTAEPRRVA